MRARTFYAWGAGETVSGAAPTLSTEQYERVRGHLLDARHAIRTKYGKGAVTSAKLDELANRPAGWAQGCWRSSAPRWSTADVSDLTESLRRCVASVAPSGDSEVVVHLGLAWTAMPMPSVPSSSRDVSAPMLFEERDAEVIAQSLAAHLVAENAITPERLDEVRQVLQKLFANGRNQAGLTFRERCRSAFERR